MTQWSHWLCVGEYMPKLHSKDPRNSLTTPVPIPYVWGLCVHIQHSHA